MRDHDAWLERPYQENAARGAAEEDAWDRRGLVPDDLLPPHAAGGACPRCAEPKGLAADDDGGLYCTDCGADVDPGEAPTFSMPDWMDEQAEEAAEAAAEARWEDRYG